VDESRQRNRSRWNVNVDPEKDDMLTHGFSFWINLPSKNKVEAPQHLAVQAGEVPQRTLDGEGLD